MEGDSATMWKGERASEWLSEIKKTSIIIIMSSATLSPSSVGIAYLSWDSNDYPMDCQKSWFLTCTMSLPTFGYVQNVLCHIYSTYFGTCTKRPTRVLDNGVEIIIIASELVVSSCFKVIKQKLYKTTYTESIAMWRAANYITRGIIRATYVLKSSSTVR